MPYKPRISAEDRQEIARRWLEFLGLPVTQERLDELAPIVMLYHPLSPKGQCANDLVRHGVRPSRKAVEKVYPAWRERAVERDREVGREFLARKGSVSWVCRLISEYRADHGVGPLWRDVFIAAGLPSSDALEVVLESLEDQGIVIYTTEPRSLDVADSSALES